MTEAERKRRQRAGLANKRIFRDSPETISAPHNARVRELEAALAQAHKRIADLERRGAGKDQLTRSTRGEPRVFGEVGRLKAEIGALKAEVAKLKLMLKEEPDAAKLRKKIIDQQTEMASLRQAMKQIAKERDKYQKRTALKYQDAVKLLIRSNSDILLKALHYDRRKQATAAELAAAHRLATDLRPLFDQD
jgi:hypothetical protein